MPLHSGSWVDRTEGVGSRHCLEGAIGNRSTCNSCVGVLGRVHPDLTTSVVGDGTA